MGERKILIAVDASEHSKFAFEWFLKSIYKEQDAVIICHVPEVPQLPSLKFKHGLTVPVDEWKKIMDKTIQETQKLHDEYEAELILRKIKYQLVGHHHKNVGEGILQAVDKEHADIIVMGTRGQTALQRTFLGSVSDYVLHHSRIPVLVCPSKEL